MKHEIYRCNNLNLNGSGVIRNAVRGVISEGTKLLLIYSPLLGEFKFPGGGVEPGETHDLTLKREISEEFGLIVSSITSILGIITEYNKPKEEEFDFFAMQSFYYKCDVEHYDFQKQNLDDYEKDLQFIPKWIELGDAIAENQNIMNSRTDYHYWTKRDTIFLQYLAKEESL